MENVRSAITKDFDLVIHREFNRFFGFNTRQHVFGMVVEVDERVTRQIWDHQYNSIRRSLSQ